MQEAAGAWLSSLGQAGKRYAQGKCDRIRSLSWLRAESVSLASSLEDWLSSLKAKEKAKPLVKAFAKAEVGPFESKETWPGCEELGGAANSAFLASGAQVKRVSSELRPRHSHGRGVGGAVAETATDHAPQAVGTLSLSRI